MKQPSDMPTLRFEHSGSDLWSNTIPLDQFHSSEKYHNFISETFPVKDYMADRTITNRTRTALTPSSHSIMTPLTTTRTTPTNVFVVTVFIQIHIVWSVVAMYMVAMTTVNLCWIPIHQVMYYMGMSILGILLLYAIQIFWIINVIRCH